MADAPRPFAFRTRHLDGISYQPGELFRVDIHLFTLAHEIAKHFEAAFSRLEIAGFGPERRRATLERVTGPSTLALSLDERHTGTTMLYVDFVTPTELKHYGSIVEQPSFPALWSRVFHRLNSLRSLYGEGSVNVDAHEFSRRAHQVRLSGCQLHHVHKQRRSSRTGQVHPLGGVLGEAKYEGCLDPFLPYLEAACWTGIGRQTVWGKGEIALRSAIPPNPLL